MESTRSSRRFADRFVRRVMPCLVAASICTATASAQVSEAKLFASDGSLDDQFGHGVALLPGWAFSGAPLNDASVSNSGAVYVYTFDGTHWIPHQKLVDGFGSGRLGYSLAASGSWLVAGAPTDATHGSAYVFQLQGGVWVRTQRLAVPGNFGLRFGRSAAVRGDRMLVHFNGIPSVQGSVLVFELSGSTWVNVAWLNAPDFHPADYFGQGLAVEGDVAVVGSPGQAAQGAVYVFERSAGTWLMKQKLTARDPKVSDNFGLSVALEGDTLLVGSRHTHTTPDDGAIYVYERQAGTWNLTQELRASDALSRPQMGEYVALDGDLAIGSAVPDGDYGPLSGSAYVFRRDGTGTWLQIAKAFAPDAAPNARFGNAVALCDTKLLVGAAGDDWPCLWNPIGCNAGSAYVFELAPDAEQFGNCPTQGPCGNHDDFGGCAASLGYGGVLSAAGSASVAQDDLRLEARWLPLERIGLFMMGDLAISQPFADGLLCVGTTGAGVWRFLPPQSSGSLGVLELGPGIASSSSSFPPAGHIAAGQTWHFQAWYRDPIGPCGSGSNLTNAVRVAFTP